MATFRCSCEGEVGWPFLRQGKQAQSILAGRPKGIVRGSARAVGDKVGCSGDEIGREVALEQGCRGFIV